jgi:hypothetical protein
MTSRSTAARAPMVFADVLRQRPAGDRECAAIDLADAQQLGEHGGNATGAMEPLTKIFACGLHVDQQRNVAAEIHPVFRRDFDARVARHGDQVRLGIGRTTDGRNSQ